MKEKWINALGFISGIATLVGILLIFAGFVQTVPLIWVLVGIMLTTAGIAAGGFTHQKQEQLVIKKALGQGKDPL